MVIHRRTPRKVPTRPCAVTGYLWGIWPHRRIVHTFHGISPLCKDIVSPPYVDIEGAFFLPRASPPQVFDTLMRIAGYKILVTGYLNLNNRSFPNPNLQRDFPLIPWKGEIAVLFIGKRKPYVSRAPPRSLLRFAIAQYMGVCIAHAEAGSPFPSYMERSALRQHSVSCIRPTHHSPLVTGQAEDSSAVHDVTYYSFRLLSQISSPMDPANHRVNVLSAGSMLAQTTREWSSIRDLPIANYCLKAGAILSSYFMLTFCDIVYRSKRPGDSSGDWCLWTCNRIGYIPIKRRLEQPVDTCSHIRHMIRVLRKWARFCIHVDLTHHPACLGPRPQTPTTPRLRRSEFGLQLPEGCYWPNALRVTVCKNYALLVTKKHSLVSRLLVTDLDFEAARAADLFSPSPHGTLHERPWRAAWLPRWGASVTPPILLSWCLQALQTLPVFSHSFPTAPFTSDLGVPPGCLGGSTRVSPPAWWHV
ncbi:hypothetical protein EDB84DRAFT_1442248 [Lactarius hengduanensis]|nr:hypothetical protein EDB84DRAFT_1442248 [Lactarius hengduanensis]